MLISRKVFQLEKAASDDESRHSLCGIHIEGDGSAVATNGHILVRYLPTEKPDPAEYPAFDGLKTNGTSQLKPFTLPASAARAVLRTVPKKRSGLLPILRNVVLDVEQTNKGDQAVLGFTDLKRPTVIRPSKIEGDFVDYSKVMPKGAPKLTVGMALKTLKKALSILDSLDVEYVQMKFRDEVSAVEIVGQTYEKDGKVLALVMPARVDNVDLDEKPAGDKPPTDEKKAAAAPAIAKPAKPAKKPASKTPKKH